MSDVLDEIFNSLDRVGSLGAVTHQMAKMNSAGEDVNRASAAASRATDKAVEATDRVERLQLVVQAMWEIMRERDGISDAELEAQILEVDLRDGMRDGKMGREVAICGSCHRKTGVRKERRCFYCATPLEAQHVVER